MKMVDYIKYGLLFTVGIAVGLLWPKFPSDHEDAQSPGTLTWIGSAKNASDVIANFRNADCKVSSVGFGRFFPAALRSSDALREARRAIIIIDQDRDGAIVDWRKIKRKTIDKVADRSDIRTVFNIEGDLYGFDALGQEGELNGEPVEFSDEVRRWYVKHLKILADNFK